MTTLLEPLANIFRRFDRATVKLRLSKGIVNRPHKHVVTMLFAVLFLVGIGIPRIASAQTQYGIIYVEGGSYLPPGESDSSIESQLTTVASHLTSASGGTATFTLYPVLSLSTATEIGATAGTGTPNVSTGYNLAGYYLAAHGDFTQDANGIWAFTGLTGTPLIGDSTGATQNPTDPTFSNLFNSIVYCGMNGNNLEVTTWYAGYMFSIAANIASGYSGYYSYSSTVMFVNPNSTSTTYTLSTTPTWESYADAMSDLVAAGYDEDDPATVLLANEMSWGAYTGTQWSAILSAGGGGTPGSGGSGGEGHGSGE